MFVMLAPATSAAVTVLSTDHYQQMLTLNCSNSVCAGDFPVPGAKRRLLVTRMSCYLQAVQGASASTFRYGYITLMSAANTDGLRVYLTNVLASGAGVAPAGLFHTLNDAVDIRINPAQHLRVALLLSSGTVANGECTASGIVEVLQ